MLVKIAHTPDASWHEKNNLPPNLILSRRGCKSLVIMASYTGMILHNKENLCLLCSLFLPLLINSIHRLYTTQTVTKSTLPIGTGGHDVSFPGT